MSAGRGHVLDLRNDAAINVAALLKERVGAARSYGLALDRLALDDELAAVDVTGEVHLTRLLDGIMVAGTLVGKVDLVCVRCLVVYSQPFESSFIEEYRQTVDVTTGVGLDVELDEDDEFATISENHELDLTELLRQENLVALPMRPDCGADCPGPDVIERADAEVVDERFAALTALLDGDTGSNRER